MSEEKMKSTGTVKWFNGFITPDGGGEDLFVHQTAIVATGFRSLREGEAVEFVIETGDDGRQKAIDVTGPGGAQPEGAPRQQPRFDSYGGGGFGGGGYGGGYNEGYGGGGGYGGGRGGGRGRRGGYGGGGYGGGGYGGYDQGGYGGGYQQGGGGAYQQGGYGGY
ncbi:hypothetical protein N2152v2_006363 [Parachlorella kessleri]